MNPTVQDAITRAAQEEGVDPAFALAVAERESSFNPNARNSRSIYGLYQMSGDLRRQYGVNDSSDPYDQAKGWSRFINDTKAGLAQRIGREPTNDELYLAHYFGEGRAARLIGGQIAPSTHVAEVFTPQELAANPNIARAGTLGALTSSIGADMDKRQARYGGNTAIPHSGMAGVDFAQFGQPDGNSQTVPGGNSSPQQPIDFAQFGIDPNSGSNSQTVPASAEIDMSNFLGLPGNAQAAIALQPGIAGQ